VVLWAFLISFRDVPRIEDGSWPLSQELEFFQARRIVPGFLFFVRIDECGAASSVPCVDERRGHFEEKR
jgi:hypothetical protein